jgi:hypothetical protein
VAHKKGLVIGPSVVHRQTVWGIASTGQNLENPIPNFPEYRDNVAPLKFLQRVTSMLPVSPQLTKTWLLKVENLSLVRACRRQIEDEFGVRLHLNEDNLLEQIQEYAYISGDPGLRRLAQVIESGLKAAETQDICQLDLANIPIVRPIRTPRMRWDKR